jgi:hypothetical protein
MSNIFSSGIELTDPELAALPIETMAAWLDMWKDARDADAYALRQVEEDYEPGWSDRDEPSIIHTFDLMGVF